MKKYDKNLTAKEIEKVGTIVYDKFDEGVRFIIMRGPASWCAYAGVPIDHPLAGFDYESLNVNAHGGLTFSSKGHKTSRGTEWPKGFWWYGWDYAHAGDKHTHDHGFDNGKDKDWTIEEVVKDSWEALYDIKKLMKFAEKIASKN